MVAKREGRERAVAGYNTRELRKCWEWLNYRFLFREKCSHEGQHDEDYTWTRKFAHHCCPLVLSRSAFWRQRVPPRAVKSGLRALRHSGGSGDRMDRVQATKTPHCACPGSDDTDRRVDFREFHWCSVCVPADSHCYVYICTVQVALFQPIKKTKVRPC